MRMKTLDVQDRLVELQTRIEACSPLILSPPVMILIVVELNGAAKSHFMSSRKNSQYLCPFVDGDNMCKRVKKNKEKIINAYHLHHVLLGRR